MAITPATPAAKKAPAKKTAAKTTPAAKKAPAKKAAAPPAPTLEELDRKIAAAQQACDRADNKLAELKSQRQALVDEERTRHLDALNKLNGKPPRGSLAGLSIFTSLKRKPNKSTTTRSPDSDSERTPPGRRML